MLSYTTARVAHNSFLYALGYFERDRDGLEGEAVGIVGAGPRRGHRRWRAAGDPVLRALRRALCESTARLVQAVVRVRKTFNVKFAEPVKPSGRIH